MYNLLTDVNTNNKIKEISALSTGLIDEYVVKLEKRIQELLKTEEIDKSNYFDDVRYNGYTTDNNNVTLHTVILTIKGGEIDAE